MLSRLGTFALMFCSLFCAVQASAKDQLHAYFFNDSVNGLQLSDAYETHNMGLVYTTNNYYIGIDLGIVSPDMYVYRNQYREANRSFGELLSLEVGQARKAVDALRFYAKIKATGKFGVDKFQDFAHRLLSLQQVNEVNELIRMPANAWVGIGLRREIDTSFLDLKNTKLHLDGFLGSDTTSFDVKIRKEFHRPLFIYDISVGGRFVAYDKVVSAPPINAKERKIIPEVSFGMSYSTGPYSVFVRDSFSLPTIKTDNDLYGVLAMGISYNF